MTADEFEMDLHYRHFRSGSEGIWDINARDGDVKIELSVYDEAVQEVVKDNFDEFSDTFKEELIERVESKWDNSEITDEERDTLLRLIEVILP